MNTTHKAYLSFIGRTQKTAKTECGRIVKTSAIAIDADCTCLGCRAEVDSQIAAARALADYAESKGTASAAELFALRSTHTGLYRTVYFL